jgi:hypothetical protein
MAADTKTGAIHRGVFAPLQPGESLSVNDSFKNAPTWYETEIYTAGLLRAVLSERTVASLSAKDIWYLFQLTWITKAVTKDHWKRLKIPALNHLFHTNGVAADTLDAAIATMVLPSKVATAAAKQTGFVNAYHAYWNSLMGWCKRNQSSLQEVLATAYNLGSNDQHRLDLASKIAKFPPVPTPNKVRTMAAGNLLTPLIACLDPKKRFPIVNGEKGVRAKLNKLGLASHGLEEQVTGFIGLIGRFGIVDAFALDTAGEDQIGKIASRQKKSQAKPMQGLGARLHELDDDERKAIQNAGEITYRNRHNKMTTHLMQLLPDLQIRAGTSPDCRYDVLVLNYDGMGRDLLIEAKPDPDRGSIRVAIGQLLDYCRFVPHPPATDLAILTISAPNASYLDLMHDYQITALWFTDENCTELKGNGKIWKPLSILIKNGRSKTERHNQTCPEQKEN